MHYGRNTNRPFSRRPSNASVPFQSYCYLLEDFDRIQQQNVHNYVSVVVLRKDFILKLTQMHGTMRRRRNFEQPGCNAFENNNTRECIPIVLNNFWSLILAGFHYCSQPSSEYEFRLQHKWCKNSNYIYFERARSEYRRFPWIIDFCQRTFSQEPVPHRTFLSFGYPSHRLSSTTAVTMLVRRENAHWEKMEQRANSPWNHGFDSLRTFNRHKSKSFEPLQSYQLHETPNRHVHHSRSTQIQQGVSTSLDYFSLTKGPQIKKLWTAPILWIPCGAKPPRFTRLDSWISKQNEWGLFKLTDTFPLC